MALKEKSAEVGPVHGTVRNGVGTPGLCPNSQLGLCRAQWIQRATKNSRQAGSTPNL